MRGLNEKKTEKGLFNRAKLLNIGFDQASKRKEFDCFMFHDVDLILENDKAIYNCFNDSKIVWHYSGYIDKFKYRLLYQYLFGGSKLRVLRISSRSI